MTNFFKFEIFILLSVLLLSSSCISKEAPIIDVTSPDTKQAILVNETSIGEKIKYKSGIRAILHDSQGNYWFGSHQEGVCLFDGKSFTYFTDEDGLSHNQVRTIQEDQYGTIWFGTGNGVSSYRDHKITNHNPKSMFSVPGTKIEGSWSADKNDVWINAGDDSGIHRLNGDRLTYLPFPLKGDGNSNNVYANTGFSKGKNNQLWFASYSAVFGYDGTSFKIFDNKHFGYTKEEELLHVRSLLEDSKGNLWIGNNGIGVLLMNGERTVNFSEQHNLTDSPLFDLTTNSSARTLEHIFAIGEDNEGNIWFGDRDTGAWKYDGKTVKNYIIDEQLEAEHIWQIYQDPNGDLLFAMGFGGVYRYQRDKFERVF